jgi:hypothetical protein
MTLRHDLDINKHTREYMAKLLVQDRDMVHPHPHTEVQYSRHTTQTRTHFLLLQPSGRHRWRVAPLDLLYTEQQR